MYSSIVNRQSKGVRRRYQHREQCKGSEKPCGHRQTGKQAEINRWDEVGQSQDPETGNDGEIRIEDRQADAVVGSVHRVSVSLCHVELLTVSERVLDHV